MGFKDKFRKALHISDEKANDIESAVRGVQNFKYLDDLIHSEIKEIILDCDIVIGEGEESEYLGGIKIDVDDLVIDGNGHCIDAENKARIFESTSNNVIIRNLTLQNGGMLYSSTLRTAGAIHNEGELLVQNCIFKSNISRKDGGTILNSYSGILTIDNTLIEKGNAGDGAGAICNRGILRITNSKLYDNSSKWNYGGAILNSKKMVIRNTSFKNNVNHGDDISDSYWRNMFIGIEYTDDIYNSGDAILIDVDFDRHDKPSLLGNRDDRSIYNKGFIAVNGNEDKIKNVGKVANFSSLNGDERDFTFLSKLIKSGQTEIRLESNIVLDVLNFENFDFPQGIEIDADDLTIDGNGYTIDSQGMGSIFAVSGKNIVIKNVNFRNARGAAVNNEGELKIVHAIFEKNNKAINNAEGNLTAIDSKFISNDDGAIGGGIITVKHCLFDSNGGRAISAFDLGASDCMFNNNTAYRGGAISSTKSSISNCVFNNNVASEEGGAIYGGGTITNCMFNNNLAKDGNSIFAGKEITIKNCIFNEDGLSEEPCISNRSIMTFFANEINNSCLLNKEDAVLKLHGDESNCKLMIKNEGKIKAFDFEEGIIDFAEIENNGRIIFFDDNGEVVGEYFTSELEWIEIKIFISSTFKDMHAERDYLCTEVFPDLKEWCRQRRILLNEIDLRWGVTADDSKTGNTINVCLKSIDECHPFFLCFIGQRRGWVPSVEEININKKTLTDYPQLNDSIGKLSITEMEIEHATLLPMVKILERDSRKTYSKQSVFFFRRNPFENVDLSDEQKAIYLNAKEKDDERLESLKGLIKEDFPAFEYSCIWDDDLITAELVSSEAQQGRLSDFECEGRPLKDIIISELKNKIGDEFPNRKPVASEDSYLDDAMLQRLDIESYANDCVGRKKEFQYLTDYVNGGSGENVLLVRGERGIGKTTLLCKWNEILKENGFSPVMRICNSTSKSNTINDLCLSIGSELGLFNGDDEKARNERHSIDMDFIEKLKSRGVNVLILSGIDKIEQLNLNDISDGFYIVMDSDMDYEIGTSHETFVLKGFETDEECLELIDGFLEKCLKNLDENQKNLIISSSSSRSPLFLRIVLNEISLFGSYEGLNDKILSFGDSTKVAFEEVVKALNNDAHYPVHFVKFVLLMLCYSRNGLNEDELLYGLSMKFNENNLKERLMIFLHRIDEYVSLTYDKYSIRYDEFAQAILDQFGDFESDVRRILVDVYRRSMLSVRDDLNYYELDGSTELLYNLEVLGDYEGIIEVFENDDLMDKVCPYWYFMHYKSGRYYFNQSSQYAGFLIGNNSEGSEFFRKISLILLKRADGLLTRASVEYPKPFKQWSEKFRKESGGSFERYRDTFYEMPHYVSASLKYAKMSFEIENDFNKTSKFWDQYKEISKRLIPLFKALTDDGADYLRLSHEVEDFAFSAERDFDRLDKLVEKLNANE